MKRVGLPYSGKYGFIETEMYWPINHMVSPKTSTVACTECHTREGQPAGRPDSDFYMPAGTTTRGSSGSAR